MRTKFPLLALLFFLLPTPYSLGQNFPDPESMTIEQLDTFYLEQLPQLQFQLLLPYVQVGVRKAIEQHGDQDTVTALKYGQLAEVHRNLAHFSLADSFFKAAINIWEKIGVEGISYGTLWNDYGQLCVDQSNYNEAEIAYLKAKKIYSGIVGKESLYYLAIINNLGSFYDDLDQFKKAERMYWEVKTVVEKTRGREDQYYAITLNNLSFLYFKMGNYEQAEELYVETRASIEKLVGKNHPYYATVINNMALVYIQSQKYEQAVPLLLETKERFASLLGVEHPSYTKVLGNLARVYESLDKRAEALELLQTKQKIEAKTLGKNSISYAKSLGGIALILQKEGNFSDAIKTIHELLSIVEKAKGKNNNQYTIGLESLADIYRNDHQLEKALSIQKEVISLHKNFISAAHTNSILAYQKLGMIYTEMDSLDLAQDMLFRALDLNTKEDLQTSDLTSFLKNLVHTDFVFPNRGIATVQKLTNLYQKQYLVNQDKTYLSYAYYCAKACVFLYEKHHKTYNFEGDKLNFATLSAFSINQGLQTLLTLKKENPSNELLPEAFELMEQNKAILLSSAIQTQQAHTFGDAPDSLVQQEKDLAKQLDQLKIQFLETKDSSRQFEIQTELNVVQEKTTQLLKKIKQNFPQYHDLKYSPQNSSVADIQAFLTKDQALIEYHLEEEILYIFSLTKNAFYLDTIPLDKKELATQIGLLRTALTNYPAIKKNPVVNARHFQESAYWCYQSFLATPLSKLHTIKHLIIVPDDILGHIPFEVLLTQSPEQGKTDYKAYPYLIKDYKVSYSYSANLLKQNQTNTSHKGNRQILGMAASYPMLDSGLMRPSLVRSPKHIKLRQSLEELPAALEEIKTLGELYQGSFLTDSMATEANFKAMAGQYSIIHLAMHGILHQRHPILSSLAFTETGDSLENNFLEAWEIAHLKLQADLVVLSACETGYGKFQQGEGILSLARSFMYAGVPSLLVSMWKVNDYATSLIMQKFYQNLAKGLDKATALQEAKLDFIAESKGVLTHPAFWSAFIQIGNTAPVDISTKGSGSGLAWILGIGLVALLGIGYGWKRKKQVA